MGIEKHYTVSMNMGSGSIASLLQKRVLHAKFILASCAEIEKKPDLSSSILNTNALAIKRHCKGMFLPTEGFRLRKHYWVCLFFLQAFTSFSTHYE